jgi:PD-(D/E)XK nuclease family transposase
MIKNSKDEHNIVEVQNNEEYDYLQRILFGACKTIVDNIGKGKSYSFVKKVVSVTIAYFDLGQGQDYIYHGTNTFKGIHKGDILMLSRKNRKIFITSNRCMKFIPNIG